MASATSSVQTRTRSATPRGDATPLAILAIVCAAAFVSILDIFVVNVAFPDIQRDFAGTSLARLSWVLNGYAIVFAALLVPAGRLADRSGQKRGFLIGLSLFTVASALCAVAPSSIPLIAARVLQAAGAAALIPTSLALLIRAYPAEGRAKAIGIWTAVGAMGAAMGPVVGGLLVELSWRWVFLINVPVGLVAGIAALRVLTEHRDPAGGRRPDLASAVLLTVGIGALALGIVEGPDWGWTSVRVVGSFGAAVLLVAAVLGRSARHPVPIVELPLLRVRSFAVASLAALLITGAFSAMLLADVQLLSQVWDYSSVRTGLGLVPGPLMVLLLTTRVAGLTKRYGARAVGALGSALIGLGCAYWAIEAQTGRAYLADFLPGIVLAGLGFGLALPTLLTAGTSSLPPQRAATGSAVITMARQIGTVLGIAILIAILGTPSSAASEVDGLQTGWLVMAAASAAAALICFAFAPLRQPQPVAASVTSGSEIRLPDEMRDQLVIDREANAA